LNTVKAAVLTTCLVALSVGAAGVGLGGCAEAKKPPPSPPPTVLVAPAVRRNVTLYTEAVATLDGYVNAEIRARVKGFLRTQGYKDGSSVKSGQLLFTIEATDYSASAAATSANLARAKVAQSHAKVQLERDQGLFRTGMFSQQDLDNAAATLADADGLVLAAQAQLEQAQLNLSYTQLRSPIDGVAGLALVRVGNLVGQDGPTLITTVSQLDPIRVNFPMSEADYTKHFQMFGHMDKRDLAWAQGQFARLDEADKLDRGAGASDDQGVALVLSDGSVYAHRGVIVSLNRQIDSSTGTIQVQALVPNPEGILRPGGYGSVRIKRADAGQGVIAVPEKALITVQGTFSLGVVGADNKVALRRVEVGPSVGGLRVIQKGIEEGDSVVIEGVQKLTDGATVDPKPAPPPTAAAPAGAASAAKN
jgi:membrane fusion protein (multidrug efflux system)